MSGALPSPVRALVGLPDFQAILGSGATQMFASFGGGPCAVLPTAAKLATRDGLPMLSLTLVKQPDQPGPTDNHATLDIAIAADTPLDDGLAVARQAHEDATVAPVSIDIGFARLTQVGSGVALPPDLTAPVPLGWSAAEGARWTHRVDVDTGELIKHGMLDGTLLVGAQVEFSVRGVAARAAAVADFVPSTLIAALVGSAAGRTIAATALFDRLMDPAVPVAIAGNASRDAIARALTDRLAAAYGVLVPAASAGDTPCFQLSDRATAERVTWDLSVPAAGTRAFLLTLSNIGGMPKDVASSLIHELAIPPLDIGFRDIVVEANLPRNRAGIPLIGVRIEMPPNPPGRPSGINRTVPFTGTADIVRTTIQIDPDEALAYNAIPFAIIAAGGSVQQRDGTPILTTDAWVRVPTDAFPMAFTHITASDRLLAKAKIAGALTYTAGGKAGRQPIALTASAPDVAVAVPTGATDAALSLTVTAADGAVATLATPKLGTIRLDFPSFAGYGPHRIPVRARLAADARPLTIELASEDGATKGAVTLVGSAPTAIWGYVAASPFHAGFRMRPAGGAWSPVLMPPHSLYLKGDGTMDDNPPPPEAFDLPVAHFVPNDDGSVVTYIPNAPVPELDANGKPTLSILSMPQLTTLQLGTHFGLSTDQLSGAMADIAKQVPALANAQLQPAKISVSKAAVVMTTETGAEAELGTSMTSAFPPYAAIFALTLTPDRAATAISAVRGSKGVLFVDYTVAPMGGDPVVKRTDIGTWFTGTDGDAHIRIAG